MLNRFGRALTSATFSLNLIGLMLLLPFITPYHRIPIPSFYAEWLAAALGAVALLPLLRRESWQPLEIPHSALLFPGFLAILFMQWLLGMLHSTPYALLAASYLAWALLLTVLGAYLRRQLGWEKIAVTLSWYLFLGGLVNVVFVALQYANRLGAELTWMSNLPVYGMVGQLNHFADYMALALVSLLYLVMKKRLSTIVGVTSALLFLAMLAFSGSRSSWLYLAALAVLALLLRAMSIRQSSSTSQQQLNQSRYLLRVTLLLIPLFALVQWAIYYLPAGSGGGVMLPTERLMSELSGESIGGIGVRLHIWYESLRLFLQSPWLGVGFGQIHWQSFLLLDDHWVRGISAASEHAHNIFIQLLAETGVAGALLLLAGVWAWLRGFQWRNVTPEGWWLLALLAVIGIHSLLEYPLWYTYFLGPVALLLGVGDEQHKQARFTFGGRVVVVAALVCAVFALGNLLAGFASLERWVYYSGKQTTSTKLQNELYHDMDWTGQSSLLSPYAILLYAMEVTPTAQNLEAKLKISETAMRYRPGASVAYRYPLLLELAGRHQEAVLFMQRAIQFAPNRFNDEVQHVPQEYWESYLQVFSEAVGPAPKKP